MCTRKANLFFLFVVLAGVSACSYDKPEDIVPDQCDLTNVTYKAVVEPILSANCYECHGPDDQEAGIRLDSYTDVKTVVDFNLLLGVIRHDSGYPAMPDNRPKMDQCSIDKIATWVEAGAQDN